MVRTLSLMKFFLFSGMISVWLLLSESVAAWHRSSAFSYTSMQIYSSSFMLPIIFGCRNLGVFSV